MWGGGYGGEERLQQWVRRKVQQKEGTIKSGLVLGLMSCWMLGLVVGVEGGDDLFSVEELGLAKREGRGG